MTEQPLFITKWLVIFKYGKLHLHLNVIITYIYASPYSSLVNLILLFFHFSVKFQCVLLLDVYYLNIIR